MKKILIKYLERNGDFKFENDVVRGVKVIRIKYSGEYMMEGMTFLEWIITGLMDRLTGFYGFRRTISFAVETNSHGN
jgi:hypothetical protein